MENKTGAFEKSDVTLFENHDPDYFNKFVAYCSDQAHSSVDKGVMLSGVRIRKLKSTREVSAGNFTVQPAVLEAAIKVSNSVYDFSTFLMYPKFAPKIIILKILRQVKRFPL